MFLPIPAIDLMDGEAVRLARGDAKKKTVYSSNPPAFAYGFELAGAQRLHVIDLDGAFSGKSQNLQVVREIRTVTSMKIEVGGGLRSREAVEKVFEAGADYAILGTAALRDRDLTEGLAADFGDKLIVGIDARDGRVAVEGWVETSDREAIAFALEMERIGVKTLIYTDIATDGMLTGPNAAATASLCDAVSIDVIHSGGISSAGDLVQLQALKKKNLIGAITGRAIYEKTLDLAEAVKMLKAAEEN